jgi:anti-sigma28 factor (negative regulator of flagellin synthesis)
MKITGKDQIQSVDRTAPTPPVADPLARPDRVTLERNPDAQAVANAASRASGAHAERLSHLATAIKAGTYHPDPSQVADQIIEAAVIDAALRNLVNGRG